MTNPQRAHEADRFRTPLSVTEWHMTRRLSRRRAYKPDTEETADNLPQAFRLASPKPPAGDKSKAPQGGKTSP